MRVVVMLSKCANPSCSASFRYFHQGKLFRMETNASGQAVANLKAATTGRVEFFWLCDQCSQEMTLERDANGKLQLIRVDRELREVS